MATCGEVLVRILEAYGIDTIFGIPGVHTVELYRGLPKTKLRHVTPRHEQGAGFMADGYARASGRPAACFIITGPGMTNIATAMGQALQDSIPMLVISSVNRTYELGLGEGRLHEMRDQGAFVAGVARFSHTLLRPEELPKVLARAFAVFASERPGPVHIEIPIDVITAPGDRIDLEPWPLPLPPGPAPRSIDTAAEWLAQSENPIIALGGGAVSAADHAVALAEALDAPVINTVNAKGVVPASHPLAVGGSGSSAPIRDALRQADVVLALGTEFGETDYDYFYSGALDIPGKLIRVDIEAAQLTRNLRPDLAIVSDSGLALDALLAKLSTSAQRNGAGRAAALRHAAEAGANQGYQAFFGAVRDALPEVVIAGDSTQPTYHAWIHYETEAPRRYFHSASGFGTLGYAIPAAIGAKLARPDQPVIGLIGDGAAQFTLGELASAVEAALPVVFLVWNNQGYGEIKRFMVEGQIATIGVDIYTPDFVILAEGFGCHGERVETLAALKAALAAAQDRPGPTVLELPQGNFAAGLALE